MDIQEGWVVCPVCSKPTWFECPFGLIPEQFWHGMGGSNGHLYSTKSLVVASVAKKID